MRSKLLLIFVVGLLVLGCKKPVPSSPVKAQSTETPTQKPEKNCALGGCNSLPIPEDLRSKIANSEAFGAELYLMDYASAVATDVAMAKDFFQNTPNIGGYIPIREVDLSQGLTGSFMVFFYSNESPPRILSQARIPTKQNEKPEWIYFSTPKEAPAGLEVLVKARQTAINAVSKEIVQRINPVVFGTKDAMIVYLLAGTSTPKLAMFGKHFRVFVSSDGSTVQDTLLMSDNVHGFVTDKKGNKPRKIEPIAPGALELPYDENTAVLTVTQTATDWPLESHVFVNLLYGVPVYVITARGLWLVENGEISYLTEKIPGVEEKPLD